MARYSLSASPSPSTASAPKVETALAEGPDFSTAVPPNGYGWWYLDAVADDGLEALTLIAFVGSVFSPYYAWARERQPVDPEAHVAINVALYRPRGRGRWAMTERSATALERSKNAFAVADSSLYWRGDALEIEINERCSPFGDPLRGRIRLNATTLARQGLVLDAHGRHRWRPLVPAARIEVAFEKPDLRWSGTAYLDHNQGVEPLEQGFRYWTWSRQHRHSGDRTTTDITYDVIERDDRQSATALSIDAEGEFSFNPQAGAEQRLPRGLWGIERSSRLPNAKLVRALEDTPFYTRDLLANEHGPAVGESLDLDRFASRWVQCLLPFRMPRWTRNRVAVAS